MGSPFPVAAHFAPDPDAAQTIEGAEERARNIMADARTAADRVRENAEREIAGRRATLEAEIAQAVGEARAEGYEEGRSRAREEVLRDAKASLAQIRLMAESLLAERERSLREQEGEILEMAIQVAEKVIRAEAAVNREMVVRTVREAVGRATEKDQLLIRIHPDDLVALEDHLGDLREEFRSLGQVQIEEDRRITRGGCVVESRSGYIDGTVEGQLQQVRRELGLMD